MGKVSELHKKWSKDPEYRSVYDKLRPEFEIARLLIEARTQAGLTQAQLAERIQTTQSAVARFESGRIHPSTNTLKKIAQATGTRLKISFEAIKKEATTPLLQNKVSRGVQPCLLYTSPSPRDRTRSRMPSSA